jgi:hypothetical protein
LGLNGDGVIGAAFKHQIKLKRPVADTDGIDAIVGERQRLSQASDRAAD